jgi:hypothetical protein
MRIKWLTLLFFTAILSFQFTFKTGWLQLYIYESEATATNRSGQLVLPKQFIKQAGQVQSANKQLSALSSQISIIVFITQPLIGLRRTTTNNFYILDSVCIRINS